MAVSGTSTTGTNIDVNSIVSQLMTIEQRPLNTLTAKETSVNAKISAYGQVKSALSTFQTSLQGLSSGTKFQVNSATSSDTSAFTASALSSASVGSHSIDVVSLAQRQRVAASGVASSSSVIGSGTLTFDFGTISGGTFNSTVGKYGVTTVSNATLLGTDVTVASTAGLTVGDIVTGGGFPDGTTITSITDGTHFVTSATGTDGSGTTLNINTATTAASFTSSGAATKTVTIDASNNSLQGIRDAINAAKIGVTASIVNDGSSSPYRLVLSADSMGASNSMKISVSGDAALSSLLGNDPAGTQNMSETTTAKNASLIVDGIAVSKTSNSPSDVIQGVTLNLLKPTTSTATIDVARDTSTVQAAADDFVSSYNNLTSLIGTLTAYNATTKKGAILQGDSAVRMLKTQIDTILSTAITNPAGSLTTLSQAGISKQATGKLAVDSAKLASALSTSSADVAALFAAAGKPSDSQISFRTGTVATKPGSYAVDISAIASQGNSIGNVNLGAGNTTIASGTSISANIDGTTATVALSAGTYTAAQLASMIQTAINGTSDFSTLGKTVAASIDVNGFLNIYSNAYGSSSSVALSSGAGTTVATFMGTATNATGTDVAGTINGVAATGTGQYLTSSSGDSTGLQLIINGGALGARGTVNYSQGYAYQLNDYSNTALGSSGLVTGRVDGLGSSIRDLSKQRDAINARLVTIEARYRRQYSALDSMLSSMNKTSTFLTQQLAKM